MGERDYKGAWGNFCGEVGGYVHYLDYSDGFIDGYMCQSIKFYALKCNFNINFASINAFKKEYYK